MYTSAAQSWPPCGFTGSRPGNQPSSVRTAVPCTHAGGLLAALPPASSVSTIAHAPSEVGHDSSRWIGSHTNGDSSTISMLMSGICRCAYGFFSAFLRSFTATIGPT